MADNDLVTWLLSAISESSSDIRSMEDLASKHSLDPSRDCVYIASMAYRDALNDVLNKIRSLDDRRKKGAGF